jgi:hypothetical protein
VFGLRVAVVPHLSIGPIGQLAHFFSAVRQYRQIDIWILTNGQPYIGDNFYGVLGSLCILT